MKKLILLSLVLFVVAMAKSQNTTTKEVYNDGDIRVTVFTSNIKYFTDGKIMFWDEWEFLNEEMRKDEVKELMEGCYKYNKMNLYQLYKNFYSIRTCYMYDKNTGFYQKFSESYYTLDGKPIQTFENRTDEELKWNLVPPGTIIESVIYFIHNFKR